MIDIDYSQTESELLGKGNCVQYKAGDKIYSAGQYPFEIFFLKEGIVTLEDAETLARKLVHEKTLFGLKNILAHEPYKETASALADSKVIVVPKARVMNFLRKNAIGRTFLIRKIFEVETPVEYTHSA